MTIDELYENVLKPERNYVFALALELRGNKLFRGCVYPRKILLFSFIDKKED